MRPDAHPDVHWPAGFDPEDAEVFAHDEAIIEAPCATVWHHLVEATRWPDWHPDARDVRIVSGGSERLSHDSRFEFDAQGLHVVASVGEFVPDLRLGWFGEAEGVRGYHSWLLTGVAPDVCQVVSEQVARGRHALATRSTHDTWVRDLQRVFQR